MGRPLPSTAAPATTVSVFQVEAAASRPMAMAAWTRMVPSAVLVIVDGGWGQGDGLAGAAQADSLKAGR